MTREVDSDEPADESSAADAACEAVIAAYLEAVAAGGRPDRAPLLAAHPELATELRDFFNSHDQLFELGSWWRGGAGANGAAAPAAELTNSLSSAPLDDGFDAAAPTFIDLPDYEMLAEIARGGMGVVYKARQRSLNRLVAVKMILQARLAGESDRQRFKTEAAAAARLKHSNIVVIHEVGEHAGQPYFSMEYVAGESLAAITRRGLLPPQQAARYVMQIARAIQCAHDNGVLHRDVKPSNVLIDAADQARVTDFGLAKQIDGGDQLTLSGQLLGTPSYMAPEQIAGPASAIGPACDIYGIGALLYELITGQPPFRGASSVETLLEALESNPRLPRHLNPNVPRQLEMIALKCLERNPSDRYASASAVADDLARFLEGDSISISSPKLLDRVVRTLERSHYDREFHAWSLMLLHIAWIAVATHALVALNRALNLPHPHLGILAIRLTEGAAMGIVLWRLRRDWYPPRGAPARQLWSLWIGYMTGSLVLLATGYLTTPPGSEFNELLLYPPMAVLGSLAFIMLGSSYWGYCYVMGGAFLALALAMTVWLPAAPLEFGLCWGASLATLGVRLGRLAQDR